MKKIKNIIFDLGGVIINLDMARTINSFEAMGIPDFRNTYNQFSQTKIFDAFDKGTISENDFFTGIKTEFNLNKSIIELKNAWNLMLLDFPKQRLDELLQLKSNYNTFLLSNTNETHIKAFEEILQKEHSINNLDSFFNKAYYSCRIGMRKPELEIFELVLKENNLLKEQTVFIDDTFIHINAAKQLGLNTILLPKGEEFISHLSGLLN